MPKLNFIIFVILNNFCQVWDSSDSLGGKTDWCAAVRSVTCSARRENSKFTQLFAGDLSDPTLPMNQERDDPNSNSSTIGLLQGILGLANFSNEIYPPALSLINLSSETNPLTLDPIHLSNETNPLTMDPINLSNETNPETFTLVDLSNETQKPTNLEFDGQSSELQTLVESSTMDNLEESGEGFYGDSSEGSIDPDPQILDAVNLNSNPSKTLEVIRILCDLYQLTLDKIYSILALDSPPRPPRTTSERIVASESNVSLDIQTTLNDISGQISDITRISESENPLNISEHGPNERLGNLQNGAGFNRTGRQETVSAFSSRNTAPNQTLDFIQNSIPSMEIITTGLLDQFANITLDILPGSESSKESTYINSEDYPKVAPGIVKLDGEKAGETTETETERRDSGKYMVKVYYGTLVSSTYTCYFHYE